MPGRPSHGCGWRGFAARRDAKAKSSPSFSPIFLKNLLNGGGFGCCHPTRLPPHRMGAPGLAFGDPGDHDPSVSPPSSRSDQPLAAQGRHRAALRGRGFHLRGRSPRRPHRRHSPRRASRASRRRGLYRRPDRLHARGRCRRRSPSPWAKLKTWTCRAGHDAAAHRPRPGRRSSDPVRQKLPAQNRRCRQARGDGSAGRPGRPECSRRTLTPTPNSALPPPTRTPAASRRHLASAPVASAVACP